MNPKPTASVLIPALNSEKTIGELLVSLKAQASVPGGFEVVVVDNGSSDRTVEIAKSYGAVVLHQPKRGPSAARNLGLAHAQGDIIVCIDSDCLPTRRLVASLVEAMADPGVGIATGPIHGWQPSTGAERYISAKDFTSPNKTTEHEDHPYTLGMHTTFRRQEGLELGGWDETFGSGEDMDFCFRHRKRFQKSLKFVDAAILFHKHRSSDEALWKQARWHGAGYALCQKKHPDIVKWNYLKTPSIYLSVGILNCTGPVVSICRKFGWMTPERAEFENYHRHWFRHFWAGFMETRFKSTE